jgi:hypothetical protein
MSDEQNGGTAFQVNTAPLMVGAALIGAGVVIGVAGLVVTGTVLAAATRRWINQMETPPGELARRHWARAKAATAAGASAWQNGSGTPVMPPASQS